MDSTKGNPATWNDKSLIMSDDFHVGVRKGKLLGNNIFKLLEFDSNGKVVEVEYKGGWFICDNGYMSWSCTIPPLSHFTTYKFIRFAEWLESMRKNVECTFGIMKKRLTILKYGFRFSKLDSCDQLWLTCCSLHNMILFHDGLDDWNISESEISTNVSTKKDFTMKRLYSLPLDCNSIHQSPFRYL